MELNLGRQNEHLLVYSAVLSASGSAVRFMRSLYILLQGNYTSLNVKMLQGAIQACSLRTQVSYI